MGIWATSSWNFLVPSGSVQALLVLYHNVYTPLTGLTGQVIPSSWWTIRVTRCSSLCSISAIKHSDQSNSGVDGFSWLILRATVHP